MILETFQVKALREHYANLQTTRVDRLKLLDTIGHVIIPRVALSFVALFWTIGLTKYNNPDLTLDLILDFLTSPMVAVSFISLVFIAPIVCCCFKRCCKQ